MAYNSTNTTNTTNQNNTTGANNNIWLDSIMGRGPKTTTNNSYSIGNGQGMFPSSAPTYSSVGTGGMRQSNQAGMPSMNQWQGGLMHDLNLQNDLNRTNFDRNEKAANMFLGLGQEGLNNFKDSAKSGQKFFDEAKSFQERGYKEAGIAGDKLNKQLETAGKQQDRDQQAALGMYSQGIGKVAEGTDKISSAMANAAARRSSDQGDQISNQYAGAFPGSESQLEDAYRSNRRDLNETVFSGVSQIQNQANQMQAQMMAGRGTLAAQLASTSANYRAMAAQAGFGAAQSQNEFNKLGSQIAMGNAAFQFQNNEAFMGAALNVGKGYADMVRNNPVMGVAVMPTLMAMGELSKQYGYNNNLLMHPDNRMQRNAETGGLGEIGGGYTGYETLRQQKNKEYARQQGFNYA